MHQDVDVLKIQSAHSKQVRSKSADEKTEQLSNGLLNEIDDDKATESDPDLN